ncbi:hypothetical protein [Streptomyces sp. NPDC002889]|uniref:hypothetical protein n=1 Tax=Streptomyces sp. NPDC002889 TaxID=3364669 RepID=UPI00368E2F15
MPFTRAATALGLAAAMLALAASPSAAADESGLEINRNRLAQRGAEIDVAATEAPFVFADEDGDGAYITLESPAFVAPVVIRQGRFYSRGKARVRCGIEPGTYTVQMAGEKGKEAREKYDTGRTTLTVTTAMDTGNRAYCAGAGKQAEDSAAEDGGTGTPAWILAGAAAVTIAAAAGGFLFFRRSRRRS